MQSPTNQFNRKISADKEEAKSMSYQRRLTRHKFYRFGVKAQEIDQKLYDATTKLNYALAFIKKHSGHIGRKRIETRRGRKMSFTINIINEIKTLERM